MKETLEKLYETGREHGIREAATRCADRGEPVLAQDILKLLMERSVTKNKLPSNEAQLELDL